MLIGTGIKLLIGAGIGFAAGICVSEDIKDRAIVKVKKRIVELLTGEKWEPKKRINTYYGSYCSYSKDKDTKTPYNPDGGWDELKQRLFLHFTDVRDARRLLKVMSDKIKEDGSISVWEVGEAMRIHLSYTWDRYGWCCENFKSLNQFNIDSVYDPERKEYKWEIDGIERPVMLCDMTSDKAEKKEDNQNGSI